MKIDHENIQPDGSAFTASVYVRGVLYIVSYVNHKLLVKLAVEVLDNYHKWLVSQGWTGPSFEMIQENAQ